MKTMNITLRKGLVASIFGLVLSNFTHAQEGVIWTRIPNANELFIQEGDLLQTRDHRFNTLISQFNITEIFQAASNSRNAELKQLYQLNCNCDENDLLKAVSELPELFINPEIGPHYEVLIDPDDIHITFPTDWALNKINAQSAWDITTGSPEIEIAISDAGYYFNHPEFVNKTTYTSNGIGTSNIAHGTAVAISAAGATNNSIGKSSIGYNSSLQLYGMNYNELLAASNMGAHVVNASWASGCYYSSYGQQIIDEVYTNGTVIVAAAGNGATCSSSHMDLVYPAAFDHVISVTSTGPNDNHERIVGDSTTTHQHNAKVDICAPGYDVALSGSPTWYTYGSGTSFAAPIVSGTIGLMLAANPCLTPDQIEFILKATANTDVLSLNPQYAWGLGAGRLDAHAAVAMAKEFSTLSAQLEVISDCGTGSQSFSVTNLNGSAPYTYEWSNNGSNTSNAEYTSAGSEFIQVTDVKGCLFYTSFEVLDVQPLHYESDISHPLCANADQGAIELVFAANEMVASINWSNGAQGNAVSGLVTGVYSVEIVDIAGCTYSESFVINSPEAITVESIVTDSYTTQDGSIDLSTFGGTSPYTYDWNTGAVSEDVFGLNPGNYKVRIIDYNGCEANFEFVVESMGSASLNELSEVSKLYPNPTNGKLYVETTNEQITLINLIDINGALVRTEAKHTGMQAIDLTALNAGVYFVEMSNGQEVFEKHRVVKY